MMTWLDETSAMGGDCAPQERNYLIAHAYAYSRVKAGHWLEDELIVVITSVYRVPE